MDGLSIIKDHQKAIISTIQQITRGDWKVLVLDENTKKIIDSSVNEDDILNHNIANIERIEERRAPNPDMDAIYFLSPKPHIVDCLLADFERRRYRSGFIVWAGLLPDALDRRLDVARRQMAAKPMNLFVDFYPRESRMITFRDPHSFLLLYNPFCNDLVGGYLKELARKISSVCITLGEFPKIRYYAPKHVTHEARVLCMHLARFVQKELDNHHDRDPNFPPQNPRPQSVLLITDRSMDLMAPLLHELTYQAMVHDLLPIKEQDDGKVTFHMTINEGMQNEEEKDMEIQEKDSVWVGTRHMPIGDTLEKLSNDFQKFRDQNPNFTGKNEGSTSLNDIRDMFAGLPQFTEMKEAYSLHVTMAQAVKNIFTKYKLFDVVGLEQTLATGLDEELKKPKGVLEQVVRLLDDPEVTPTDRLRLIAIYTLFRDGMIDQDIMRLLWHAQLQRSRDSTDKLIIDNLELLGARPLKDLKEARQPIPPLFPPNINKSEEVNALSRFEPVIKQMLEDLCNNTLDQSTFPFTIPPPADEQSNGPATQASLRSAAPRWASANRRQVENRQRIIVFVAGGATYSESRVCYEVSEKHNRDVYLVTSHLVAPNKYLEDLRLLNADRRRLNLPIDQPPPKAPAHLFERPAPPPQQVRPQAPQGMGGPPQGMGMGGQMPAGGPRPPTKALGAMTLNSGSGSAGPPADHQRSGSGASAADSSKSGKKDKGEKEKKKRNIFGIKK